MDFKHKLPLTFSVLKNRKKGFFKQILAYKLSFVGCPRHPKNTLKIFTKLHQNIFYSCSDEIGKKLKKLKASCKPFNQKQSATTTLTAVETGNGGHCRSRVGGVEVGKKKKQVVLVTTTTVAENGGGLATGNVNVATENTGSASADASAKLLETSL